MRRSVANSQHSVIDAISTYALDFICYLLFCEQCALEDVPLCIVNVIVWDPIVC